MGAFSWAFKTPTEISDSEIPEIFPLTLLKDVFIKSDILGTYLKILTDTMERTHGLKKDLEPLLWDNCVQNESSKGLISLLAEAMTEQAELFLVFTPSVKILRKATFEEAEVIRKDYKARGESAKGVFISFKGFHRTEMLRVYSAFEYCVLSSLHKTLNLSKAVQVKVNDLRSSVGANDSEIAKAQARSIAKALAKGSDVLIDAKDEIMTATPDTSTAEKAIAFLDSKRAFILGLPLAYVSGEQTGGIGTTGEADMRAVERGLKQYFTSVLQPALKTIFKAETEFKSQDFRTMTTALETLKTFDLVTEEYLSSEAKKEVLARLFDLDPKEEEKNLAADAAQAEKDAKDNPPPVPAANPNQPPAAQGNGAKFNNGAQAAQ